MFLDFYKEKSEQLGFKQDQQQLMFCKVVDDVILQQKRFFSLKNVFSKRKQGLYVYGPVGTGKTTLIDLLYVYLNANKYREHSKLFLLNLQKNGFEKTIELYKQLDYLFLDELDIIDIADAMIIKRLFEKLNKEKVFIIVTSNAHPSELYRNGLHYDRFEPFVFYLRDQYHLFELNNGQDYRQSFKTDFSSFLIDTAATQSFIRCVDKKLQVLVSKDKLILSFHDLFEQPLGPVHYQELSTHKEKFIIYQLPTFNKNNEDALRRFMTFIDIFYDQKKSVKLIPNPYLDIAENPSFSIERLKSRLIQLHYTQLK